MSHSLPFNVHHSADRPLYAIADPCVPRPQPSPEPLLVSKRVSARQDRASGFFKALCAWYRPAVPVADDLEDQPVEGSSLILPALPVDWTRKEIAPQRRKPRKPLPTKFRGDVLQKGIYTPDEKWAWTAGLPFRDSEPSILLSSGVMCSAFLKTGHIGDRPIKYVSKMWLTKERWHGFFSELALYKVQLKSLQGRVVPTIINVFSCAGAVDVAMEPPHHSFWIEASPDMPHVLKKRCVQAFEKLHACGVYHGDIELRHMLIGGDARVTIIDFQASRALVPNAAVQLEAATPDELRMEMRKVKFKLDYEGARTWEDEKLMRAARLSRRNQEGRKIEEPLHEDRLDPPIDSREWNLEWIGAPVEPARFVMPGQTAATLESAVGAFLSIIEGLEEEEEARQDGASTKQHRQPSPDFKPPAAVHKKPSSAQSVGCGFGATVVHPRTTTRGPRVALKRKGECDRSPDAKRIRIDVPEPSIPGPSLTVDAPDFAASSTHTSPSHPPIKVRDFAYETAVSPSCTGKTATDRRPTKALREPKPTRLSMLFDNSTIPSSSAKRKRPLDSSDELPGTRGQPKLRTALCCDVTTQTSLAPQLNHKKSPINIPTPTPILFRWMENLWRFVH